MEFWQVITWAPPDEVLDLTRATEDAGFDGIMVSDHVFYPQQAHLRQFFIHSVVQLNADDVVPAGADPQRVPVVGVQEIA